MFESALSTGPKKSFGPFIFFSVVAHVLVIGLVWSMRSAPKVQHAAVKVVFRAPIPPPPPPPPLGGAVVQRPPVTGHKIVKKRPLVKPKPKVVKLEPKPEPKPEPVEAPTPTPAVAAATPGPVVPGGQAGGVAGGVAGGTVGGKVGAPLKPKNVAAFQIQHDVLQQLPPRLSEVFKQSHRGQGTIFGMYKVCVGTDGHVFDVIAVKPVPGADSDIMQTIREGWLYRPQKVPVCFLYNMPITIEG